MVHVLNSIPHAEILISLKESTTTLYWLWDNQSPNSSTRILHSKKKSWDLQESHGQTRGGAGGAPSPMATPLSPAEDEKRRRIQLRIIHYLIGSVKWRKSQHLGHRPLCISIIWNVERYLMHSIPILWELSLIRIILIKGERWICCVGLNCRRNHNRGRETPENWGWNLNRGRSPRLSGGGVREGYRWASSQKIFENVYLKLCDLVYSWQILWTFSREVQATTINNEGFRTPRPSITKSCQCDSAHAWSPPLARCSTKD